MPAMAEFAGPLCAAPSESLEKNEDGQEPAPTSRQGTLEAQLSWQKGDLLAKG